MPRSQPLNRPRATCPRPWLLAAPIWLAVAGCDAELPTAAIRAVGPVANAQDPLYAAIFHLATDCPGDADYLLDLYMTNRLGWRDNADPSYCGMEGCTDPQTRDIWIHYSLSSGEDIPYLARLLRHEVGHSAFRQAHHVEGVQNPVLDNDLACS